MNILPMIFVFLLIFGGISLAFIRDIKGFFILESSSEGLHRTQRVVSNAIAQKAYRKFKGEALSQKQDSSEKRQTHQFQSRRSFFPPLENSKFNLAPLFEYESEFKLHPLYHSIAEFLRLLYQTRVFDKYAKENDAKENWEYLLLDALLEKGRRLKTVTDFTELAPEDPNLYALYYKLLKGTNNYTEEKGIPLFEHYFSLTKGSPIIYFSFASPPLLEALFGKTVKDLILKKEFDAWAEEKKYVYFSKEDLNALIAQHPSQALSFSTIEPLLEYSKAFVPRTNCGGKDKITNIVIIKNSQ